MNKIFSFFETDNYSGFKILGIKIKTKKKWNPKWYVKLFKFFQYIDKWIPKKKNRIIFCSWPDFSDNAKVFYEYLNKYHNEEYDIIWAYRNNAHYKILKDKLNCKLVFHFSFECLYYALTSKYICITHDDLFCYDYKKHVILNFFHGMPVKTVGFAEKNITAKRLKNFKNLGEFAHLFATTDIFKMSLAYCFRAYPNNIHITGQARTDSIFNPSENAKKFIQQYKAKYEKIILYMPTYKERKIGTTREIEKSFNNIFYLDDYNETEFLDYLEQNKILFLMKPHPQDEFFYRDYIEKNKLSENLKIIFDMDLKINDFYLYEIFSMCDLMISDYSSVAIDWLILKKPILYLSTVVDEYIQSRGMCLEDNYKMLLPGEKINNFSTLLSQIECNIKNPNIYEQIYKEQLTLLHKYFDGNSCKRIYETMREL